MINGEYPGDSGETISELQVLYLLQQIRGSLGILAPHLPGQTLQDFVRITDEVTVLAAQSVGIDPERFANE